MGAAMGQATSAAKSQPKKNSSTEANLRRQKSGKSERAHTTKSQSKKTPAPKAATRGTDNFDDSSNGDKPAAKETKRTNSAHGSLATPLMQQPVFSAPNSVSFAADVQGAGRSLLDGLGMVEKQLGEYWSQGVAGIFGDGKAKSPSPFGEVPGVFRAADKKSNEEMPAGNGAPENVGDGSKSDLPTQKEPVDSASKVTRKQESKSRSRKKAEKFARVVSDYNDIIKGTQKIKTMENDRLDSILSVLNQQKRVTIPLIKQGLVPQEEEKTFLGRAALKGKMARDIKEEKENREEEERTRGMPIPTYSDDPIETVPQESAHGYLGQVELPVFPDEKSQADMNKDFTVATVPDIAALGVDKFIKNSALKRDVTRYNELQRGYLQWVNNGLNGDLLRLETWADKNPDEPGAAEILDRMEKSNDEQIARGKELRKLREKVVFRLKVIGDLEISLME